MTWFDFSVVAVIGLSILFAVIRGAFREIGTLVALAAAAGLAFGLVGPVRALVGAEGSFLATAALAGAIGLTSFIGFYFLLHIALAKLDLSGGVARIDRIAGAAFGLARGLVLVALGFVAYSYYLGEDRRPAAVTHALTLPAVQAMARAFEKLAPPSTRLAPEEEEASPKSEKDAAALGYDRGERAALAEIVTTVTTNDPSAPKSSRTEQALESGAKKSSPDPIADMIKESDPQ